MNNQCPQCGNNLKLVPAGVSKKTGKAYDAFFACTDPTRMCTFTQKVQAQGAPLRAMNNVQTKNNDQKDLEKSTGMVRHGFAIESFKMGKKLDPITAREITNWTNFVMTGKLLTNPATQPAPMPTMQTIGMPVIQVEEENIQEEPYDEEVRIDNIPF